MYLISWRLITTKVNKERKNKENVLNEKGRGGGSKDNKNKKAIVKMKDNENDIYRKATQKKNELIKE